MATRISPLAGKPTPAASLVDVARLVTAYYTGIPDPAVAAQRVVFGTSGHRGSSFELSFNEHHVLAITQAICRYRKKQGVDGPLYLGIDTHALSEPACASALEVLAANGVETMLAVGDDYTPTPAVSHAILNYNRGRSTGVADGIVVTPSHNPPTADIHLGRERRSAERRNGGGGRSGRLHAPLPGAPGRRCPRRTTRCRPPRAPCPGASSP